MKKFILTITLLCLIQTAFCQTYSYVPIPTANAKWKMSNRQGFSGGSSGSGSSACFNYQYGFTGKDSSIAGINYYEMEALRNISETEAADGFKCLSAFNTPLNADRRTNMWMLEKSRKIYLIDSLPYDSAKHSNAFYIDFGVTKPGDQVSRYPSDTVIAIDTININGSLRRRIIADSRFVFPGERDTLIEGIGSIRFGLHFDEMHTFYSAYPESNLICFTVNGTPQYNFGNSSCADIWPLSIEDTKTGKPGISIAPNPFHHTLKLKLQQGSNVQIFNTLGSKVYNAEVTSGKEHQINTSGWASGVYFYLVEHDGKQQAGKLLRH